MGITRRNLFAAGCGTAVLGAAAKAAGTDSVRIANPYLAMQFRLVHGGDSRLPVLRNLESGFNWTSSRGAFTPAFSNGVGREPVTEVRSWKASGSSVFELVHELRDTLAFQHHFQLIPDLPVAVCSSQVTNIGSEPLPEIGVAGLRIPLRADSGPLEVYCVSRDSYAVQRVPVSDQLEFAGGGWNQPGYAGLLALHAPEAREFLVTGVECERGWHYRLKRAEGVVWLSVEHTDLPPMLKPGGTLALPRIFFCTVRGEPDDAFRVAQRYVKSRMAPKSLPNWPWVVYDIWGTEPEGVEEALLNEIGHAASLGVELFYVDAAWYEGSSRKGNGDWGGGLGNYREDRTKFTRGLAYMSKQVHDRSMKFGLWVGPNIVDSRLVPDRIPSRWVAQKDGADRVLTIKTWESPCLQVCLGCPEYVTFLKQNLSRIVSEFTLDWLKWDNSGIPGIPGQCNRADHGHSATAGSYAALQGQYEVFRYLHEKFPDLVLEQCGYGSRLDLGLATTIRANWLSDASFPSAHVRQNSLVAGYVYPSSYNGAWVLRDKELESTTDASLLDTIYRSRMMGLFGFGTLHGTLPERISLFPPAALEAARRNIPVFKQYRHLLSGEAYHLFPPPGSAEGWQAVQFNSTDNREAVVLCFRNNSHQRLMRLPVKGLLSDLRYRVTSANGAAFPEDSGATLLREGLVVRLDKPDMSDVLLLRT